MKLLKHNKWKEIESELIKLKYSDREIKLIKTCLIVGLNLSEFDEDIYNFQEWNKEHNDFFDLEKESK